MSAEPAPTSDGLEPGEECQRHDAHDTCDHPEGATLYLGGTAWAHPKGDAAHSLLQPIDSIHTYPGNPRRGDQDEITASIRDLGFYGALQVQTGHGHILVGNHRYRALADLGALLAPVDLLAVSDTVAAAVVARDNYTSDQADNDPAELVALLERLVEADQLSLVGGLADDLAALRTLAEPPATRHTDPDDVPDIPEGDPISRPGDVWELGPHRLLVGDARDPQAYEQLMGGQLAELIWTDPPYNVDVAGGTHDPRDQRNHGKGPRIGNDKMSDADFRVFLRAGFTAMLAHVRPGGAAYICHADTEGVNFRSAFKEAGFSPRQVLIWAKQQFVFGRSDYHWQHEPILYGWRPGAAHLFRGERNQSTVWAVDRPMRSAMEHPTQKPMALVSIALANSSGTGDLVLDPYAGSGSTLIACDALDRVARLIDNDPRYADVICRRYQAHTGVKPERDGQAVDFT